MALKRAGRWPRAAASALRLSPLDLPAIQAAEERRLVREEYDDRKSRSAWGSAQREIARIRGGDAPETARGAESPPSRNRTCAAQGDSDSLAAVPDEPGRARWRSAGLCSAVATPAHAGREV